MTELDKVLQIKKEVLHIQGKLMSSDVEDVKAAMKEYTKLVDRFYHENKDFIAPQQYNAIRRDFEYFIFLVELAAAYHEINICEEGN